MLGFDLIFWYWWVLAMLMLVVELLTFGFFFLWMAVAALITGLMLFLFPTISSEIQLLLFSVFSFVAILIWKRYFGLHHQKTDHPLLNQRGAQYIGRTFTLIEGIKNGQGKIRVGDSIWKVQGDDCPLGSKVKVISINGTVFKVKKME